MITLEEIEGDLLAEASMKCRLGSSFSMPILIEAKGKTYDSMICFIKSEDKITPTSIIMFDGRESRTIEIKESKQIEIRSDYDEQYARLYVNERNEPSNSNWCKYADKLIKTAGTDSVILIQDSVEGCRKYKEG